MSHPPSHSPSDPQPRAEKHPLYTRIEAFIRSHIEDGSWPEGHKLPAETELAAQFSTTRSTVAKALQKLVFDGRITRRAGSGSYVSHRPMAAKIDIGTLRSFASQLGKEESEISYKLLSWGLRAATTQEAELLALPVGSEIYHLERLRLSAGSVIGSEIRLIPRAFGEAFSVEMMNSLSISDIFKIHLGIMIDTLRGHIRATSASSHSAKLLGVKRGAALLLREFTVYDRDGQPLTHGRSYYPDDFRIAYEAKNSAGA